ncbi:hypothetical protein GCM10009548_15260 [Streptomyces malaysiensis subsp. malaysiensis]
MRCDGAASAVAEEPVEPGEAVAGADMAAAAARAMPPATAAVRRGLRLRMRLRMRLRTVTPEVFAISGQLSRINSPLNLRGPGGGGNGN